MDRASVAAVARHELPLVARIVVVALVSWWLATLLGAEAPVYAVLAPVIAVRNDPFASFTLLLGRVVGVIVGVLVGVTALALLDPGIWAVAAVLVVGLLCGMVLRIGGGLNIQVAVSGLLVVALGDPPGFAWSRTWQTCVGAAVTVVLSPLLLPPNPAKALRTRLDALADDLSDEVTEAFDAGVTRRTTGSVDAANALPADLATAARAAEINPLQHRHRPALDALRVRVELATAVAPLVALYVVEVHELTARPEEHQHLVERRHALEPLASSVAAAVHRALTGQPFHDQTAAAAAALRELRAADPRPVSVVMRRPLGRIVEQLEAANCQ